MNPRVIGANLVVSIKTFSREKTAMFFTIAFPIILILVFGTIFLNQDNVSFDLYVQDLDQTNSSAQLVKTLELNGKFKITNVDPAVNAAQYAKDNKVNLVLVIPKGYERSLLQRMVLNDPNASVTITYIYDPSSSSVSTKMQILNSVFAGINQEDVREAAVHPVGRDIDTHQEVPVHRVLHPRHHRDVGDDVEPVRHGELEHGAAAEGRHQEAIHHAHHPYRLDTVEHPVPVHTRGHIHDCDAAGELRRV